MFQDLCSQGNKNNLDRFIFAHFLFVYKKAYASFYDLNNARLKYPTKRVFLNYVTQLGEGAGGDSEISKIALRNLLTTP